jgi:hypothetical protein
MSSLATAWTSLVLLVLTFWALHQQFQHEHHHDDDDNNNNSTILADYEGINLKDDNDNDDHYSGWSNDTYVLLMTTSATSLALSTLSLVISFLPCSSARTIVANSNINHQQHHQHDNDQEAATLRQPLLQSSSPPRRGADGGTTTLPRPRRVVEGVE